MLVLYCFLLYFCGVQEQIIAFEGNETFFETFYSNACIYENYFVPLLSLKENNIKQINFYNYGYL